MQPWHYVTTKEILITPPRMSVTISQHPGFSHERANERPAEGSYIIVFSSWNDIGEISDREQEREREEEEKREKNWAHFFPRLKPSRTVVAIYPPTVKISVYTRRPRTATPTLFFSFLLFSPSSDHLTAEKKIMSGCNSEKLGIEETIVSL